MSMRDRLIKLLLDQRGIAPTPRANPYFADQARIDAKQRLEQAMIRTDGDRAAAVRNAQDTIARAEAFADRWPMSERQAQLTGRTMREQDEVIRRLNNGIPVDVTKYGGGINMADWDKYAVGGGVGLGAATMGGVFDPAGASTPATFEQRWWPQ